ncbi:uncharacterized protein METZ01_LOCUS250693 [marine metagenome]|uniref:Uncharacterized protein n=1 Tax=marine metagenome TaxID=408172 RepID=A0A382IEX4_9ZZZZ
MTSKTFINGHNLSDPESAYPKKIQQIYSSN